MNAIFTPILEKVCFFTRVGQWNDGVKTSVVGRWIGYATSFGKPWELGFLCFRVSKNMRSIDFFSSFQNLRHKMKIFCDIIQISSVKIMTQFLRILTRYADQWYLQSYVRFATKIFFHINAAYIQLSSVNTYS